MIAEAADPGPINTDERLMIAEAADTGPINTDKRLMIAEANAGPINTVIDKSI